jgi:hypothetical protein
MTAPIGLRIGARVRCIKGDAFIDAGTEGVVVNTSPAKPFAPARARILWDNACSCMMDATDFEVIPTVPDKPQQPVVMETFSKAAS